MTYQATESDATNLYLDYNFSGTSIGIRPISGNPVYNGDNLIISYAVLENRNDMNLTYFQTNPEFNNIYASFAQLLYKPNVQTAFQNIMNGSFPTYQSGNFDAYTVLFQDVAKVQFDVAASVDESDIAFGQTTESHYLLGAGSTTSAFFVKNPEPSEHFYGDIWVNAQNSVWSGTETIDPGSQKFKILLEEIIQSLGVDIHRDANTVSGEKYDKDNNPLKPEIAEMDNHKYTVTSYNNHPDMASTVFPSGLQLYDIAALQAIYGANTSVRAEDGTTYKIDQGFSADPFIYTIWDGGGVNDTIDAFGYQDGVQIDLREGHFSSIGKSGSFLNSAVVHDSGNYDAGNVAIAYGTEIENAKGTDEADSFILNALNNDIDGRGGNDEVDYSHVNTTINAVVSAAQITASGVNIGTDTLISIEKIIGGAGIDILDLSSITSGVHINGDTITIEGNDTFKLQYEGFENLILTDAADTVMNVNNITIFTEDGADKIELGSNLYLADLNSEDRLTHFGFTLGDSIQFSTAQTGSVSDWTLFNAQGVRYAYNTAGDLVVDRFYTGPDAYTYIAGHTVDLYDSTNSTAGISVFGIEAVNDNAPAAARFALRRAA